MGTIAGIEAFKIDSPGLIVTVAALERVSVFDETPESRRS
jgi:hypothetical protein